MDRIFLGTIEDRFQESFIKERIYTGLIDEVWKITLSEGVIGIVTEDGFSIITEDGQTIIPE
jgi:hypothetical protein